LNALQSDLAATLVKQDAPQITRTIGALGG
jgi:hypothetical protein